MELTAREYAVLYELAVHAPRVLTHSVLLQRVWGPERIGDAWLVRDVVKRLRRKLGNDADNPSYIHTELRAGYRMARKVSSQLTCNNADQSGDPLAVQRAQLRQVCQKRQ